MNHKDKIINNMINKIHKFLFDNQPNIKYKIILIDLTNNLILINFISNDNDIIINYKKVQKVFKKYYQFKNRNKKTFEIGFNIFDVKKDFLSSDNIKKLNYLNK